MGGEKTDRAEAAEEKINWKKNCGEGETGKMQTEKAAKVFTNLTDAFQF